MKVQFIKTMALLVILLAVGVSTAMAQAAAPAGGVLQGGVVVQSQPDLLGVWNVQLKSLHRHPRFVIRDVQDNALSGIYTGMLGTFPMKGSYDADTGNVFLSVDFSESRLHRLRGLRNKSLVGQFQGKIEDGKLCGIASMPDVTGRSVRWEAKKAPTND